MKNFKSVGLLPRQIILDYSEVYVFANLLIDFFRLHPVQRYSLRDEEPRLYQQKTF